MKSFKNVVVILSIIFIVYIAVSFIEILVHNTSDFIYSDWNAFKLFLKAYKKYN